MKYIIPLLVGALLGSGLTCHIFRGDRVTEESSRQPQREGNPSSSQVAKDSSSDPFGGGSNDQDDDMLGGVEGSSLNVYDPSQNEGESSQGFGLMDMSNKSERDIAISLWYMDQGLLVDNLQVHTGHRFKKKIGKLHASPVEILEEQLAFMKAFLAESRRLEKMEDGR